jgi:hypothetical protein
MMSTSKIKLTMSLPKRSCDECDACCYTMEILEIKKYQYHNCVHQKPEGGCEIWGKKERPNSCNTWNCAWLFGWYPEECRPDKSGIVFYPVAAHLSDAKIAHIVGQEVWDGAINSKLGKQAFDLLSSKMLTVIRHFASNQFSIGGPKEQIEIWKKNVTNQ